MERTIAWRAYHKSKKNNSIRTDVVWWIPCINHSFSTIESHLRNANEMSVFVDLAPFFHFFVKSRRQIQSTANEIDTTNVSRIVKKWRFRWQFSWVREKCELPLAKTDIGCKDSTFCTWVHFNATAISISNILPLEHWHSFRRLSKKFSILFPPEMCSATRAFECADIFFVAKIDLWHKNICDWRSGICILCIECSHCIPY